MTLPVLAPARPVLTPPSHLGSPPRPACPHQAKATSSGPPSSKMSASGHLYFLFLLLGLAPSSWTQDTSMAPHLGTSMAPYLDMVEKNHSTPSEEPLASSLSTARSPTTSELQLTSRDPTKDGEGNLEPRTVASRTRPQTPSISSDEYTLRKRGLIAAAILFITGILILTSDRCRQFRWCRRQQRSAYRVTQA
ncbi:uncharacterized protein LOC110201850 isoform X6 [Phascolarctos cinereus]